MNLFSCIKYSGHKQKFQLHSSRRQKQHETVLSSERLEPRHIISDSFNALGGMDEDIALGVLPNMNRTDSRGNPYIVSEAGYGEDEGRAMAQLVHAIAPDAELYFATPYEKIENQTRIN